MSSKEHKAMKLAKRKAKVPYSEGPRPRAINMPVAKDRRLFKMLEEREMKDLEAMDMN